MNCSCDMAPVALPSGTRLFASRGTPIEVTEGVFITVDHDHQCPFRVLQECAELVRAAGCMCFVFAEHGDCDFNGEIETQDDPSGMEGSLHVVERHDSRCPQALAAAIEARR